MSNAMLRFFGALLALGSTAVLAGCAGAPTAPAAIPNGGADTTPLAKCRVAADHDEPLVTEWPSSYKARLEALLHRGGVAVSYSGCELHIVEACALPGSYEWRRTTLSRDSTDIGDEDELYAKLHLGAAGLSGTLRTSGSLHVLTTVSGQMQLTGAGAIDAKNIPACAKATHVVTALSVGAFKLVAGGEAGAKVEVGSVAGASGHESASILREAGDPARCAEANATEPSADCRSPIQVFLEPLAHPSDRVASIPPEVFQPVPPPAAPEQPASKVPRWIMAGAGVLAAAVGGGLLVDAGSEKSTIQKGGLASGSDIASAASRAATDTNVAITCFGGGALLVALALPYLLAKP